MNDLNEESPSLDRDELKKISKFMKVKLKKHQETSVKAMLELERMGEINLSVESFISRNAVYTRTLNPIYPYMYGIRRTDINYKDNNFLIKVNFGILADKVGSGKTFDILGMICHTAVPVEHPKIISSTYCSSVLHIDDERCIPTNLIVIPHNLTTQWKKALEYTKLKHYVISKRAHIDKLVSADNIFGDNEPDASEKKDKDGKIDDTGSEDSVGIKPEQCVANYTVVLLSATMMEDYYNKFPHIKYARIIIDEVTTVKKLPYSFNMKSNFVWYISATPSGISYVRRTYIRDMVQNINCVFFNKMVVKNNDQYITQSMKLPELKQIIIRCDTPISLRAIMEFVPQDVINMLNAGNIKEAITRLNCNIDTEDNIINVLTSTTEKRLHNKQKELEYQKSIHVADQRAHNETIKKIETEIQSLETRLQSIKDRIKAFENENCPICLSDFTSPAVVPCCGNIFCLQCLTMVRNKCPMCRTPFTLQQLHIIDNEADTKQKLKEKKLLSKKENLINIIKKKENGRFLVFSNYDATNDNIATFLSEAGIKFSKLVGSHYVVDNTIEKFSNGDVKVLILNARNYGSGLNLQMATDIVIYHELDKEVETQVIGRSQRMGRVLPLNVYYLLYENEQSNCNNPTLDLNIFDEDDEELKKLLVQEDIDTMDNIIDLNTDSDDNNEVEQTPKKKKGKKKVTA